MATSLTRKVIQDLHDILEANPLSPKVTINELKALAETTEEITTDIALQSVLLEPYKSSSGRDAYNRRFLINIYCTVDCSRDTLKLFDVVDSLENSILDDTAIWETIVNRDIVTITYDNAELAPYRTATMLVEALIRLEC